MSEPEKRTPISVYLTPKAAMVLREYNMGSGYGSVSRTVEEIILAFDGVYKNMKIFNQSCDEIAELARSNALTDDKKAVFFISFFAVLSNISNALSRLQPEGTSSR